MSYGFQVRNNEGKVVADSNLTNYVFNRKGEIMVTPSGSLLPSCSDKCLMFFRCNLPLARVGGRIFLCSMGSYRDGWWSGEASVSGTVEFFIFSPPQGSGGDGYGVEVFNEVGEVTFSSESPALRIIGRFQTMQESVQYAGSVLVPTPFSVGTGMSAESATQMAFSLDSTRVYWTSTRFSDGFTDVYRKIRGFHVTSSGDMRTSTIQTGAQRYSGWGSNFNRSPNANMPVASILIDVGSL